MSKPERAVLLDLQLPFSSVLLDIVLQHDVVVITVVKHDTMKSVGLHACMYALRVVKLVSRSAHGPPHAYDGVEKRERYEERPNDQ